MVEGLQASIEGLLGKEKKWAANSAEFLRSKSEFSGSK